MPERPRSDRLLRDELVMLQREARRRWLDDDDFAETDPAGWSALSARDDRDHVRLTIGYDEPGCVHGDADLPYEDDTVDEIYVHGKDVNPKHLARVLRTGGMVYVMPPLGPMGKYVGAAMTDAGFDEGDLDPQGRRCFTLTHGQRSLEQAAPLFVDEHVMGERVIRTPRKPYR